MVYGSCPLVWLLAFWAAWGAWVWFRGGLYH